jgi:hypothetical protein
MIHLIAFVVNEIPLAFGCLTLLAIFVLTPLGVLGVARPYVGTAFFVLTQVFSIMLWLSSVVVVYAFWGLAAAILTTLLAALPAVLCAFWILLWHGMWTDIIGLVVMAATTVGSGVAAYVYSNDAPDSGK